MVIYFIMILTSTMVVPGVDFKFLLLLSAPGNPSVSKPINHGTLSILGLHPTVLPFTKISFFTDKKELQKSATALGYVAHVRSFSA